MRVSYALHLVALLALSVGLSSSAGAQPAGCDVEINPGQIIDDVLASASSDDRVFCLSRGVYRQRITPPPGWHVR